MRTAPTNYNERKTVARKKKTPVVMMSHVDGAREAQNAMQNRIIADGLVRLKRDTLVLLRAARCFASVWSPGVYHTDGKTLKGLRYYNQEVGRGRLLRWCDDRGGHIDVGADQPLYVTVEYAGPDAFVYATQVGAAVERYLGNNGFTLQDYRQHEVLGSMIADGALVPAGS